MDTFLMTPLGNDRGNWVIESDNQGKLVFLEKQSLSLKPLREEGLNKEAVRKKKKKKKEANWKSQDSHQRLGFAEISQSQ